MSSFFFNPYLESDLQMSLLSLVYLLLYFLRGNKKRHVENGLSSVTSEFMSNSGCIPENGPKLIYFYSGCK